MSTTDKGKTKSKATKNAKGGRRDTEGNEFALWEANERAK